MTKWRPEGWNNQFAKEWDETRYGDFETGADAMLEALREDGTHLTVRDAQSQVEVDTIQHDSPHVAGTWVFIPDEKIQT